MKKRITKTVDICDLCQCERHNLTTCLRCRNEYCLTCRAIMSGCVVDPPLCEDCGQDKRVVKIVDRYGARIGSIVKKRDAELSALLEDDDE